MARVAGCPRLGLCKDFDAERASDLPCNYLPFVADLCVNSPINWAFFVTDAILLLKRAEMEFILDYQVD